MDTLSTIPTEADQLQSTSQSTEGTDWNTIILASVGAFSSVLLVAASGLSAALCIWLCSRRRFSQSAPEDPPQYVVTENEAYGTLTQHPQEQQVRIGGGVTKVVLENPKQFVIEENETYMAHTHHLQGSDDTDPSGYYNRSHWKEEDEIVNEAVYELS